VTKARITFRVKERGKEMLFCFVWEDMDTLLRFIDGGIGHQRKEKKGLYIKSLMGKVQVVTRGDTPGETGVGESRIYPKEVQGFPLVRF
jgi:hypothetical protein